MRVGDADGHEGVATGAVGGCGRRGFACGGEDHRRGVGPLRRREVVGGEAGFAWVDFGAGGREDCEFEVVVVEAADPDARRRDAVLGRADRRTRQPVADGCVRVVEGSRNRLPGDLGGTVGGEPGAGLHVDPIGEQIAAGPIGGRCSRRVRRRSAAGDRYWTKVVLQVRRPQARRSDQRNADQRGGESLPSPVDRVVSDWLAHLVTAVHGRPRWQGWDVVEPSPTVLRPRTLDAPRLVEAAESVAIGR